jgi:uncharacterized membrane protein (DUF485 family)
VATAPTSRSGGTPYEEVQASEEFSQLRATFRRFVFPVTAGFLVWYFLYVFLSAYAPDFMSTKVVGNINVGIIFGLLQFVSTFLIAGLYARYMNSKVDDLAHDIDVRYDEERTR